MNDIRPCGNNEKWCESCISKGKCNYTKNQGIIAELETIKEKVKRRNIPSKRTCRNVYEVGVLDGRTTEKVEIMDIIEKEIAELKGENNG